MRAVFINHDPFKRSASPLVLFALMLFPFAGAWSMTMSAEDAVALALNWTQMHPLFVEESVQSGAFSVSSVEAVKLSGGPPGLVYHVSFAPHGYVVVSGDDRLFPVLAFSPKGQASLDGSASNTLRALLQRDTEHAAALIESQELAASGGVSVFSEIESAMTQNQEIWSALSKNREDEADFVPQAENDFYSTTSDYVAPLLSTTWGQAKHYNHDCPTDLTAPGYYDLKAPAGCVAVAGGQVMKYHAWPPYGSGSHRYTDPGTISGVRSASFSDNYDWDSMLDEYSWLSVYPTGQVNAVAELLYELGVSVEMDYESYGSAACTLDLRDSLREYFYFESPEFIDRGTDPALFDAAMRSELLAGRPVLCAIPGHAIVADGIDNRLISEYLHINYGWSGQNDDWYLASNVTGAGLDDGLFGVQPRLMGLFTTESGSTVTTAVCDLEWKTPSRRSGDFSAFRLQQGQMVDSNVTDSADALNGWNAHEWTVSSPGRVAGSCFARASALGSYPLEWNQTFLAKVNSYFQFWSQVRVIDAEFHVEISTDGGGSWTSLYTESGTGAHEAWAYHSLFLGSYAGQEIRLRFRYDFPGGSFWTGGGVKVDDITLVSAQAILWQTVDDAIAPATVSYPLNSPSNGNWYFQLTAHDGVDWQLPAPLLSLQFDVPNPDSDGDSLPDVWELEFFASMTNLTISGDWDEDGYTDVEEYALNTAPDDAGSRLEVVSAFPDASGASCRIVWQSAAGMSYRIERSEDLVVEGLSVLASNVLATPPMNVYTDTTMSAASVVFYRVAVEIE